MTPTTKIMKRPFAAARAFTLIELLIVIALTGLLLGLMFGPIIQGFKLTNKARSLTQAQDATRFGTEQLNRELSQAAYVFDNSNTPVIFPLQANANDPAKAKRNLPFTAFSGSSTPSIVYSKLDFIPSATQAKVNSPYDPTTNLPLGGSDVRLPVAPGTRYVRYFVGLRNNVDSNNNKLYYENVYEFPRSDNDLNPFILYRAEYDPADATLINQTAADPYAIDGGGINDPDFFYNTTATSNGKSYAQNWKAIANPVLSTTNMDVIAFRRDSTRQIVAGSPIQLLVSFTPSAVNGDTTTPGFLTNSASEAPSAVPSLYTSKFGQWTYPFTVTLFRGSTQNGAGSGKISITFDRLPSATGSVNLILQASIVDQSGVFGTSAVTNNNFYWVYSKSSGKIFVTLPNATFLIDAQRGRIETALPPLMANTSNVVQYLPDGGGTVNVITPGQNGNYGELIPLIYRKVTRDPNAGTVFSVAPATPPNDKVAVADNQGLLVTDLAEAAYYQTDATSLNSPLGTGGAGSANPSPFVVFGGANNTSASTNFQGVLIVPGSERVQGPDNNLSNDPANAGNASVAAPTFTYFRVPNVTSSQNKRVDQRVVQKQQYGGDPEQYTELSSHWARNSNLTYFLETSLAALGANNTYVDRVLRPALNFTDKPNPDALNNPVGGIVTKNDYQDAGLPAKPAGAAGPERDVQVSFLWQNNYARAANGYPVDTNGNQASVTNADIKAEPDVVTVSYGTRALINLNIGTRVYDTSSGQPQLSTVSDKIKVNNVGR